MNKIVEKAIDHCIHHKFLSADLSKFSFLGLLLQHRIQDNWFQNNVTVSNEALMIKDVNASQPLSVDLLQILQESKSLVEPNAGISFASISVTDKKNGSKILPKTIEDLIEAMPLTCLNLHTFAHPSQKIDHFTLFQKKRRSWWKSFLHQPELIKIHNVSNPGPLVEQRIEVGSSILGGKSNNPLEVISIWKPEVFDQLEADEKLKSSIMFKDVNNQKKTTWPCLITSQTTLEPATLFCLIDAFTSNKNISSLVLHHSLAPFTVGVAVGDPSTEMKQLQDLRRLLTIKLNNLKISVLPSSAKWNTSECDARGLPYLILLDDSTLENGICHLRNRDTTLKEEVHVSDVVQRLHTVLKK